MKQHSIYCSAFRHFFKNLENMLRLRQVQFIHRSVSPYKISRISCVNIFTMGKRTLAIKHTLEKNLFYKLFNWLRNKTSISLLLAANRKRTTLVTINLLKERWHNQPFKKLEKMKIFLFLCVQNQRMTTDCEKRHFYNQTSDTKLQLLRLVETSVSSIKI